jgi:hypothetical protein
LVRVLCDPGHSRGQTQEKWKMTGRERLNAVLRKQVKDRLPWTTLVDNATLALLPEGLRGNGGIDFYKHLGCDIFLLYSVVLIRASLPPGVSIGFPPPSTR